jgi:hypothetical protein
MPVGVGSCMSAFIITGALWLMPKSPHDGWLSPQQLQSYGAKLPPGFELDPAPAATSQRRTCGHNSLMHPKICKAPGGATTQGLDGKEETSMQR